MTEDFVRLNVYEIGILLSALQLINQKEENQITKKYGDISALYDKLHLTFQQMDTLETDTLVQSD